MIKRNLNKVPKPCHMNPAAVVMEDTIKEHKLSQVIAAKALGVTPQLLNNVIKGHKSISVDLAMRFEIAFKMRAGLLLDLQTDHKYRVAYHQKQELLRMEVTVIA